MRKKVTVVGAGNVGATAAMRVAEKELAGAFHRQLELHERAKLFANRNRGEPPDPFVEVFLVGINRAFA